MGTGVRNDYPGKGHRSDLEAGFGTRRRLPRGAEVCAALHELSSRRSRRRRRDSGRSHRRSCGVYAGRPTQPSLQTAGPAAFSAGSATLNACTIIDVRSSQHRNARSRLRPMSTAFAPHRRAASRECNSVQRTELQTVAPRRADERTVGNLVPRVAGNEVGLRRAVLQRLRAGDGPRARPGSPHGVPGDPQGSPQAAGKVVEMWTIPRAQNAENPCRGRLHGPVPTRRFALAPSTERE